MMTDEKYYDITLKNVLIPKNSLCKPVYFPCSNTTKMLTEILIPVSNPEPAKKLMPIVQPLMKELKEKSINQFHLPYSYCTDENGKKFLKINAYNKNTPIINVKDIGDTDYIIANVQLYFSTYFFNRNSGINCIQDKIQQVS